MKMKLEPNWDHVQKTLDLLKTYTDTEFNMRLVLHREVDKDGMPYAHPITAIEALNHPCGTVACLVGFAALAAVREDAEDIVNLTPMRVGLNYLIPGLGDYYLGDSEFDADNHARLIGITEHIYLGRWKEGGIYDINKKDAIAYLTKAVENRDLFVTLEENNA